MKKVNYRAQLLGIEIKTLRKQNKMSQDDLGWKTGMSRAQISRIERGKNNVSEEKLRIIEDAMNLPYQYFDHVESEFVIDEGIEHVLSELKVNLMNRELSEKNITIVAHVAKAVADILEEIDS